MNDIKQARQCRKEGNKRARERERGDIQYEKNHILKLRSIKYQFGIEQQQL